MAPVSVLLYHRCVPTTELDKKLYPRLAEYLESIPGGIKAHPTAMTRSDYSIALRAKLGALVTDPALPEEVLHRFRERWKPAEWIRVTTYVMLSCLARDRLWKSDASYEQGMFDLASAMYKMPLHRALMLILSPTLMVMGAAKRWHNFHLGTQLDVAERGKNGAKLKVTFPDRLFNMTVLKSLGATFSSAVTGAGAKNARVSVVDLTTTSAVFEVTWE